ncbi:FAD-dependent monooxygenase [Streptomyces sp. NPDC058623]|uniref:FAD-dependent monooxygenase n=1 Tax=Streptomyces sp. NPDC058623 TaxID=3346563 RepID=UPI003653C545
MTTTPPEHVEALIIGGGYAGLLAASVVALAGYDVLVLAGRSDSGPKAAEATGATEATATVREPRAVGAAAAAQHGEVLHIGGMWDVNDLAYGSGAMLRRRGARTFPLPAAGAHLSRTRPRAWGTRELLTCSRDLLTEVLREVVVANPAHERSTAVLDDARAVGLIGDESAVLGARVLFDDGTEREVTAQLVVDASGADALTTTWLGELGVAAVPVTTRGTSGFMASRRYWAPEGQEDVALTSVADGARSAVLVPIENGLWTVTQTAPDRERITGGDAFAAAALALSDPGVGRLIAGAEPAGEVVVAPTSTRWHRYERIRGPRGFVVIGDALATFSPLDARGQLATEAAARSLRVALGRGISHPTASRRAQQAIAEEVAQLWSDPQTGPMGGSQLKPVTPSLAVRLARVRTAAGRLLRLRDR